MTEHPEALPLEQSCVKPGHWLIEGHDVKRIVIAGQGQRWNVRLYGAPVGHWRTLREVREYIRANP